MKKVPTCNRFVVAATTSLILAGCASQSGGNVAGTAVQPTRCPPASKVRFSEFRSVEIKSVEATVETRNTEVVDRFAKTIDGGLIMMLGGLFPKVTPIPCGGDFTTTQERTLQIEPRITSMHLVSELERTWFTWAAGDTTAAVQVIFRDSATGQVLADPVFIRDANAFWASNNGGNLDLMVPEKLVADITQYTRANR